ncbi:MAG TPA: hypothetical protein VK177_19170 [Flavobacteriales bacterium]|nr:hypothetical protein [Flavobacteriales bacterium]
MNRKLLCVAFISTSMFYIGCSGEKDNGGGGEIKDTVAKETGTDSARLMTTKQIMYSIPSTAETADLLKEAGTTYDIKMMNDVKYVDKYNVLKKQALNLGIYGADLNYANVFEKSMEVQLYMESCQSLVKKLGIEGAISDNVWDRLEENKDDRDSLNFIISEVFFDLDTYLEENDKTEISGLIVAGGWIEGLFIATQMVNEKKPNQELLDRIAEQKLSLDNLCKLMTSYTETENIKSVSEDLHRLQGVFGKIEIVRVKGEATTNSSGVTTIGGKNQITFPMEVFTELKLMVKEIRNSYAKP